ncbi:hypothetical protein M8J76_009663 [Diaphorina citri]|nr:hypothetical protein M8J76_009663 [Diaphorina citri]
MMEGKKVHFKSRLASFVVFIFQGSKIHQFNMAQPTSSVLFREIHKNAWLKRLPVPEKKALPNKKGVKVWVVFCVHDDIDPFLEFYLDQEQSAAHKPVSSVALNQTLHVSPTICAHEDEFEFVVTLQSDIVRLTASSWDQMMEWVESITGKLREMRILSPKENHYSKMPEQRPPLLPTRDPNSPLPLPPLGPSSLLPGVEPVLHLDNHVDRSQGSSVLSPVQMGMIAPSTESSEYTRGLQRLLSRVSSLNEAPTTPPPPPSSQPTSPSPLPSNVTVIEVNASDPTPPSQPSTSRESDNVFNFAFVNEALTTSGEENDVFFTPPATPGLPGSIARFINPLGQHISNSGPSGGSNATCDPFAPCTSNTSVSTASNHTLDPFSPITSESARTTPALVRVDPFAPIIETPGAVTTSNESGRINAVKEDNTISSGAPSIGNDSERNSNVVTVSSDSHINIVPPSATRHVSRLNNNSSIPSSKPSSSTSVSLSSSSKPASSSQVTPSCKATKPTVNVITQNSANANTTCLSVFNAPPLPPVPNNRSNIPPLVSNNRANIPLAANRNNSSSAANSSSNTPSIQPVSQRSNLSSSGSNIPMANRALASTTPTPPAISSIPSFNKPSSPVPSSRSGLNSTPPPRRNSTSNDEPSTNGTHANSNGHGNLYEHLFLASDPPNGSSLPAETSVTSQANNSARSRPVTRTTVNPQPNRPRRRSASNSETSGHPPNVPADRIRGVSQRTSQQSAQPALRLGPVPPTLAQTSQLAQEPLVNPSRLTLREQQVLQLKREMMHPGGVRLQLRRKDCVSSIALVDAFNAVW